MFETTTQNLFIAFFRLQDPEMCLVFTFYYR